MLQQLVDQSSWSQALSLWDDHKATEVMVTATVARGEGLASYPRHVDRLRPLPAQVLGLRAHGQHRRRCWALGLRQCAPSRILSGSLQQPTLQQQQALPRRQSRRQLRPRKKIHVLNRCSEHFDEFTWC